ncbi:MAG: DUF2807 domain-containing protein [Tannerella sp.]|jgi:autonomous glycyl radical cofactor GrcA|nr:DUF2807 domain-containing protein [Tannerella sp.]
MKVKTGVCSVSVLAVGMLLTGSCFSFRGARIKGDGNVEAREITIRDYDAVRVQGGSMKVDYRQSDDAPGLTVTVDRNIFEMYRFEVHDGELIIEPKEEYKHDRFVPTQFTVVTNSTGLRRVKAAGRVEYTVGSPLRTEELNFSLAGGTKVDLKNAVVLRKLEVKIAGSGTLNLPALTGETFESDIAGSGRMNLGGEVARASFEIAGSGTVHAFDLQAGEVKCKIAGSGYVEASANNSLQAEIAGSGDIRYRGNPQQVNTNVAGSGKVRKAD